jgi:hypothetical protein
MKFHSKNLYNCREPVLLVWCIFWKFIYIIIYIYYIYIMKGNISLKLQGLLLVQAKRVLHDHFFFFFEIVDIGLL